MFVCDANAATCRNFVTEARRAIGAQVLALQRIEHEASDRLKGLDSRPFDVLLGEARKAVAIIVDSVGLKEDEGLERCRNGTVPVRKICADAARALADVLEKLLANPKPDYDKPDHDKPRFADTAAECEKLMELKPLKSVIRGTD